MSMVAEITSKTPVVCNVVSNSNISCINLYKAGGVPAVMKTTEKDLDVSVLTVTGETLQANLDCDVSIDRGIIRVRDDPTSAANGIQVLCGNANGLHFLRESVDKHWRLWSAKALLRHSSSRRAVSLGGG